MHEMSTILLDGQGGARRIAPDGAPAQDVPQGGVLWVYVRQSPGEGGAWLDAVGGDAIIAGALMAEETRPR